VKYAVIFCAPPTQKKKFLGKVSTIINKNCKSFCR
jgi:hypothetical protein